MISETVFRQIMSGKDHINDADIDEMLEEYYRYACVHTAGVFVDPLTMTVVFASQISQIERGEYEPPGGG